MKPSDIHALDSIAEELKTLITEIEVPDLLSVFIDIPDKIKPDILLLAITDDLGDQYGFLLHMKDNNQTIAEKTTLRLDKSDGKIGRYAYVESFDSTDFPTVCLTNSEGPERLLQEIIKELAKRHTHALNSEAIWSYLATSVNPKPA